MLPSGPPVEDSRVLLSSSPATYYTGCEDYQSAHQRKGYSRRVGPVLIVSLVLLGLNWSVQSQSSSSAGLLATAPLTNPRRTSLSNPTWGPRNVLPLRDLRSVPVQRIPEVPKRDAVKTAGTLRRRDLVKLLWPGDRSLPRADQNLPTFPPERTEQQTMWPSNTTIAMFAVVGALVVAGRRGAGGEDDGEQTTALATRHRAGPIKKMPAFMPEIGVYDAKLIAKYYSSRPFKVAGRLGDLTKATMKVAAVWKQEEGLPLEKRTRGDVLRQEVSNLGPVFVKLGQTLAARDDLIGSEAANALKGLQQWNPPFPTEQAFKAIQRNLGPGRPLAPGFEGEGHPIFAELDKGPIAAASLGQVYKGKTWEGDEVAVKVQRPGLTDKVSLDMHVLTIGLVGLRYILGTGGTCLKPIATAVGEGLFRELDFLHEARNADEFRERHAFLGFISAPRWYPSLSTTEVLTMQWIEGRTLSDLEPEEAVGMMQMAVEASVAQLLQTGLVHADPHEGNMIMGNDGLLYFIDFGLMSRVEAGVMESFASGIIHLLAGNFKELATDFYGMGWVNTLEKLDKKSGVWVPCPIEEFCQTLEDALTSGQNEETGLMETSRQGFGDLLEVLASLSQDYKFQFPPYAVLLGRTFATLEGICSKADPDFNIYEASLPYAVRRGLAPATPHGAATLRASLLTDRGALQWARLQTTLGLASAGSRPTRGTATDPVGVVRGVLGKPEGKVLRDVLKEVDTKDLIQRLSSPEGRPMRHKVSQSIAAKLSGACAWLPRRKKDIDASYDQAAYNRAQYREHWQTKVMGSLAFHHIRRLFTSWDGVFAVLLLMFTIVKVLARALLITVVAVATFPFQAIAGFFEKCRGSWKGSDDGDRKPPDIHGPMQDDVPSSASAAFLRAAHAGF